MFARSSMLASLLFVSAALATPISSTLTARAVKPGCEATGTESSCSTLVNACLFFTGDGKGAESQLWHQKACIAAASCYGVGNLVNKVSCQVGAPVSNQQQISLDYNIYAGIVGNCAWAPGGCPITQQNYIDFYYRTLSELNSSVFPSSATVVINYWSAIAAWTKTGATIPYVNFNDWLHYSTYPTQGPITSIPVPSGSITTIIDSSPVPVTSTPISTVTATPVPVTSSSISISEAPSATSSLIALPTNA